MKISSEFAKQNCRTKLPREIASQRHWGKSSGIADGCKYKVKMAWEDAE